MPFLNRSTPNHYSTSLSTVSSTAVVGDNFGFNARTLQLATTEAVSWYFNPTSTNVCTTQNMRLIGGNTAPVVIPAGGLVSGFAAYTTDTGATAKVLNIAVFGD